MCPPNRGQRRSNIPAAVPIYAWLDTAYCCMPRYYHNVTENITICRRCYEGYLPQARSAYLSVSRHYIHIGGANPTALCENCNCEFMRSRPVNSCGLCQTTINDFAQYLFLSGDDPYNSTEPTIVAISEERERGIIPN